MVFYRDNVSSFFFYHGFVDPDDGVGVGLDVVGHDPSFRCASGDLHWTLTVEPGAHVPVTEVLAVRWIIQYCVPSCTVSCLLSQEHTEPLIVSVCPNAMLPNMHPTTIVHAKIFIFMPPFNS